MIPCVGAGLFVGGGSVGRNPSKWAKWAGFWRREVFVCIYSGLLLMEKLCVVVVQVVAKFGGRGLRESW